MSIVKVKTKGQLTLPVRLRELAGLRAGDLLEAKIKAGIITLTPKSLVDKGIIEGMTDIKAGRYHSFATADSAIAFLNKRTPKKRIKATNFVPQ